MTYEYRNIDVTTGHSTAASNAQHLMLSASTLDGNEVFNHQDENLGTIKDIMLDVSAGKVCYAVMSSGGFLGMGEKLFAVPWGALALDTEKKRFMLDVAASRFQEAPGFDKDQWPNMADATWASDIDAYYRPRTDIEAPKTLQL